MIVLPFLMILGAMAVMVICLLSIKEEIANGSIIKAVLYSLLFIAMLVAIGGCAVAIRNEIAFHKERYPASEYSIETEIATRGESSDTTYVIVKK